METTNHLLRILRITVSPMICQKQYQSTGIRKMSYHYFLSQQYISSTNIQRSDVQTRLTDTQIGKHFPDPSVCAGDVLLVQEFCSAVEDSIICSLYTDLGLCWDNAFGISLQWYHSIPQYLLTQPNPTLTRQPIPSLPNPYPKSIPFLLFLYN